MAASSPKHDVFQAIADPTRRRLLKMLAENEMSIAAMTECFTITRTAVNKHLHILSEAGLVSSEKRGRETCYRLEAAPLAELKEWVAFFEIYWDERLAALKTFVEADKNNGLKK